MYEYSQSYVTECMFTFLLNNFKTLEKFTKD